ncbi:MAG: Chaperone protein DnaJ, partial [uncultured Nocardioides sp.]
RRFPQRLGDQGLLRGAGGPKGRLGRRDQEGLPQAGACQPPRLQPGRRRQARHVQGGRRGLRRRRRCGQAQEVRRVPLALGDRRLRRRRVPGRLQPGPLGRPGRLRHQRPAPRAVRWWRRLRRHVRRPLRRRGRRTPASAAGPPAQGRRPGDDLDHQLRRRPRGRDDLAPADLRPGVPDLQGHRGQARHPPAHLRGVRGCRLRRGRGRRSVLDERDLPDLPWSPARLRRGVPDVPRQRTRHLGAHHPGAHPGRRQGRAEDPAPGEGIPGRERRSSRRPHRQGRGLGPPGLRSQGRQPHRRRPGLLRRGCPRRRDQDPDARRRPRHVEGPARHAQRAHLPGPGQGRAQEGRDHGRPARHGPGRRAVRPQRPGTRGARELPRRHAGDAASRRALPGGAM